MTPYFSFEKDLWTERKNAQLQLCRFERFHDRPVLACGGEGSPDEHAVGSTNVLRTGDHFTMWYHGMRPPPKDIWHMEDQQWACIAKSHDGICWEKPDLKLSRRDWNGAPDNVLPDISRDFYGVSVMQDGAKFRLMLSYPRPLKIDEPKTTFSIYSSDDGIHWTGQRKPCIQAQHFEPNCSLFKFRNRYWVLGQGVSPYYHLPDGSEIARVMFAYESADLKNWKFHRKPAHAYPIQKYFIQASVQNHTGASPVDHGRIAVGMMGQLWPGDFSEKVRSTFGLVYSLNGREWHEPFAAEPLLMPVEGTWESGMLVQGTGMYSRGDQTYYWYAGYDGGNLWSSRSNCGICRIRRNGFSYFTPQDRESCRLETAPITVRSSARHLYLNTVATKSDGVKVEFLDPRTHKVLAGSTVRDSGVLVPAGVAPGKQARVSLRFTLQGRTRLYGFYFGSEVEPRQYLQDWR